MFKKDQLNSLYYESEKNTYSLLEGITSNKLTSDIIFILKEPTEKELQQGNTGELIGFVYGGFSELQGIEETIKDYEKQQGGSKEC